MVDYYIQTRSFWRHNKTGRVLMLMDFDTVSGACLLIDDGGRSTNVNGDVLENLYHEIGEVEAVRLVEQAGRHGWDKAPSRPIAVRPLVNLVAIAEVKRKPGRPRKVARVHVAGSGVADLTNVNNRTSAK
jgi:hypothetical protein